MPMVRMFKKTDEPANVRVYNCCTQKMRIPIRGPVRLSKSIEYEKPYTVTGGIKLAGSKQEPKGIYVQIELSERGKVSCVLLMQNINRRRTISG